MTPYLNIFAAADEAAMTAISTAVSGDACVRADVSAVYVLSGAYGTAANWHRQIGLASLVAAAAADRAPAILLASLDIDAAGPWQGRKYDPAQEREFPRLAYGDLVVEPYPLSTQHSALSTSAVWDWDSTTSTAIVPELVRLACVIQADAILDGSNQDVLEEIRKGLASQSVGSMSESYRSPAELAALGVLSGLCERASRLMARYWLRTGKLR